MVFNRKMFRRDARNMLNRMGGIVASSEPLMQEVQRFNKGKMVNAPSMGSSRRMLVDPRALLNNTASPQALSTPEFQVLANQRAGGRPLGIQDMLEYYKQTRGLDNAQGLGDLGPLSAALKTPEVERQKDIQEYEDLGSLKDALKIPETEVSMDMEALEAGLPRTYLERKRRELEEQYPNDPMKVEAILKQKGYFKREGYDASVPVRETVQEAMLESSPGQTPFSEIDKLPSETLLELYNTGNDVQSKEAMEELVRRNVFSQEGEYLGLGKTGEEAQKLTVQRAAEKAKEEEAPADAAEKGPEQVDSETGAPVKVKPKNINTVEDAGQAVVDNLKDAAKPELSQNKEERQKQLKEYMEEYVALAPKYEGMDKGLYYMQLGALMMAGKSPRSTQNIGEALSKAGELLIQDDASRREFEAGIKLKALQYGIDERARQQDLTLEWGKIYDAEDRALAEAARVAGYSPEAIRSLRENYGVNVDRVLSTERTMEVIQRGILRVNEEGVAGLGPAFKEAKGRLFDALGLDAKGKGKWKNRPIEELRRTVKASFQGLVEGTLASTQSANSISDRDVDILLRSFFGLTADQLVKQGPVDLSLVFASDESILQGLQRGLKVLQEEQRNAFRNIESYETEIRTATNKRGESIAGIYDPYRDELKSLSKEEEAKTMTFQTGSMNLGDDGVWNISLNK